MESGLRRPHVVVVPLATRGHVNPMMQFAELLAAQGVTITFVNTEFNSRLVTQSSRVRLQQAGLDIRFEALPDGLPDDLDRTTNVLVMCESLLEAMPQPFEDLLANLLRHAQPPPSCVLADTWMTFAVAAALKFGLPHANFWTQSAASFASLLMIANGSYSPSPGVDPHISGAEFLKEEDLNTFARCNDPSDFMFRFVTGGFDRLRQSKWIFINTFRELEGETLEALQLGGGSGSVQAVGPLLPPSFFKGGDECATLWAEEGRCLRWLDAFPPKSVVYVSFGSLALVSAQQIEEIALGLEASAHPFLWVTRPDLIYGKSPNFNEDFLLRVKDRACFVPWAPQLQILTHKALGAFFTHGGWNSTLEGISAGVPMLGWPYFSDQPMDCKCIEQGWKIGLRLQEEGGMSNIVPRHVVEAKVKALMCSEELHTKAQEWSLLAKLSASPDGFSFKNICNFVNDLKSNNQPS